MTLLSRSSAMLNEIDPKQAQEQIQAVRKTLQEYAKQEAQLAQLITPATASAAETALLQQVQAAAQKARPEIESAMQAADDGDTVTASLNLMTRAAPAESIWRQQLGELIALQNRLNDEAAASAEAIQSRARWIGGVLVVAAMALGLLIAWRITASITQPIARAVVVAERIARGDLTSQVEVRIHDETGRLLEAIAAMQDRLRSLVAEIGQAADSILVASSEVASGNQDLSIRTEQTSHNLQGASQALGDLTGTVAQSAQAAHQANGLAAKASTAAAEGGEVVTQVVQTMDAISASSRKISDITSVIDSIAFQTNILALNAAVEAARAGEQGRGFAVVASEVRGLAGRAANAAREIKALINDSTQQVQAGATLVNHAGDSIAQLVQSVRQVSSIMAEITAATQEQSQRITEVSHSVGSLEDMTQQNAALVEEGAAAAESLKDQAGRLTQMVHTFRLTREHAQARAWGSTDRSGHCRPGASESAHRPASQLAYGIRAIGAQSSVAQVLRTNTLDCNAARSSTRTPPYSTRMAPCACSAISASLTRWRDSPTR